MAIIDNYVDMAYHETPKENTPDQQRFDLVLSEY